MVCFDRGLWCLNPKFELLVEIQGRRGFIGRRELLKVPSICLVFTQRLSVLAHFHASAHPLHSSQGWSWQRKCNRKEVDHWLTKHPVFHFSLLCPYSQYQKVSQYENLILSYIPSKAKKSFLLQVLIAPTRMPGLLICNRGCAEWCKVHKDL